MCRVGSAWLLLVLQSLVPPGFIWSMGNVFLSEVGGPREESYFCARLDRSKCAWGVVYEVVSPSRRHRVPASVPIPAIHCLVVREAIQTCMVHFMKPTASCLSYGEGINAKLPCRSFTAISLSVRRTSAERGVDPADLKNLIARVRLQLAEPWLTELRPGTHVKSRTGQFDEACVVTLFITPAGDLNSVLTPSG